MPSQSSSRTTPIVSPFFVRIDPKRRNNSADRDIEAGRFLGRSSGCRVAVGFDFGGIFPQRMAGDVEPQGLLFMFQLQSLGPRLRGIHVVVVVMFPAIMPNRPPWPTSLSRCFRCPQSMARSTLLYSSARFGLTLSNAPALIRLSMTRLLTVRKSTRSQKSKIALERLVGNDRRDCRFADILDRGQTETNSVRRGREVHIADVDVGRQDRNSHLAAFVDVLHDLFLASALAGQNRRHEIVADSAP